MKVGKFNLKFFIARVSLAIYPIEVKYIDCFENTYNMAYDPAVYQCPELSMTISTIIIKFNNKWYMINSNNEIDFESEIGEEYISHISSFKDLNIDESNLIVSLNQSKVYVYVKDSFRENIEKILSEYSTMYSTSNNIFCAD